MKKNIVYVFLLIYLCTFISGCSNSIKVNNDIEIATTSSADTNPFLNDTGNTNLGAFSFGVVTNNNEKQVYEYNGKEIHIPFRVAGMDEKVRSEFGLLVFVDGLSQPYKIVKKDGVVCKEQYMQKFNLANNETQEFDIVFNPITGKKGDRVGIVFSTVLKPDFMPESEKCHNYGVYHSLNANVAQEIYYKSDITDKKEAPAYKRYSIGDIPQIKKETLGIVVDDGDKPLDDRLITELSAENKNQDIYHAKNGKIKLELYMYGGTEATYRTVFFINHEPIQVMGSDYIETETPKGKMCTVKLEIDVSKYSKLNTLYAITTPAGKDYMAVSYFPIKTRSFLIVNDK